MEIHLFVNKLKELRKQANLTQQQLGEKLGVAKNTVSYWESGISQPSLEIIKEIANQFQVTIDYLLGNEIDGLEEIEQIKRLLKQSGLMVGDDLTIDELHKALQIVDVLKEKKIK